MTGVMVLLGGKKEKTIVAVGFIMKDGDNKPHLGPVLAC